MSKGTNMRSKLEDNIGRTLFDINSSNIFLDLSPKTREIKVKINKWNPTKLKSCCMAMETTDKTKRQTREWEKIFANDVNNKELKSKVFKQLIRLNIKKTKNPIKKCAEDLNRHFSKEDIQAQEKMLNITIYYKNTN